MSDSNPDTDTLGGIVATSNHYIPPQVNLTDDSAFGSDDITSSSNGQYNDTNNDDEAVDITEATSSQQSDSNSNSNLQGEAAELNIYDYALRTDRSDRSITNNISESYHILHYTIDDLVMNSPSRIINNKIHILSYLLTLCIMLCISIYYTITVRQHDTYKYDVLLNTSITTMVLLPMGILSILWILATLYFSRRFTSFFTLWPTLTLLATSWLSFLFAWYTHGTFPYQLLLFTLIVTFSSLSYYTRHKYALQYTHNIITPSMQFIVDDPMMYIWPLIWIMISIIITLFNISGWLSFLTYYSPHNTQITHISFPLGSFGLYVLSIPWICCYIWIIRTILEMARYGTATSILRWWLIGRSNVMKIGIEDCIHSFQFVGTAANMSLGSLITYVMVAIDDVCTFTFELYYIIKNKISKKDSHTNNTNTNQQQQHQQQSQTSSHISYLQSDDDTTATTTIDVNLPSDETPIAQQEGGYNSTTTHRDMSSDDNFPTVMSVATLSHGGNTTTAHSNDTTTLITRSVQPLRALYFPSTIIACAAFGTAVRTSSATALYTLHTQYLLPFTRRILTRSLIMQMIGTMSFFGIFLMYCVDIGPKHSHIHLPLILSLLALAWSIIALGTHIITVACHTSHLSFALFPEVVIANRPEYVGKLLIARRDLVTAYRSIQYK